jgi:hypothetical protein
VVKVRKDKSLFQLETACDDVSSVFICELARVLEFKCGFEQELFVVYRAVRLSLFRIKWSKSLTRKLDDKRAIEHLLEPPRARNHEHYSFQI